MVQRLLSACSIVATFSAFAQDGTLDLSFGTDGLVISDAYAFDDQAQAVVVQPDGRTVIAGYIDDGSLVGGLVQRFQANGSLDPSFGTGGVVMSLASGELRYAYGVALQSDGGIVVAGVVYDASMDGNVMLIRYLPDGTADPDFGTNGLVSSDLGAGPGFQSAWAVHVLPDDRILIIGESGEDGVCCARFLADGTLDDTFGENGVADTGVPFGSGLCLAVQSDGAILAGGYRIAEGLSDWMLARFSTDGVLDPAFGDGGIAITDIGSDDIEMMRGVDVFPDGRIVACGYRGASAQDHVPTLVMYDSAGEPVPSFGMNGILSLPFTAPQWGQARAVHAQADNTLLVAGFRAQPGGPANNDFFLYRLLADGTPDATFAGAGRVFTDVGGGIDQALAMAAPADGSVVLAGFATDGDRATALARYVNHVGTGVAEQAAIAPRIFPVPATDHLFVADVGNAQVTLWGTDGRALEIAPRTFRTDADAPLRIDLPTGIADGTYLLRLHTNERDVQAPIIVQRGAMR